jgi:hypothetical protein
MGDGSVTWMTKLLEADPFSEDAALETEGLRGVYSKNSIICDSSLLAYSDALSSLNCLNFSWDILSCAVAVKLFLLRM